MLVAASASGPAAPYARHWDETLSTLTRAQYEFRQVCGNRRCQFRRQHQQDLIRVHAEQTQQGNASSLGIVQPRSQGGCTPELLDVIGELALQERAGVGTSNGQDRKVVQESD